jgi:AcrR family transcriptional regulator
MYHVVHGSMYHMVHAGAQALKQVVSHHNEIITKCLGAFIQAGTLDLSLDQLSVAVGVSKRMLIHYFGGRDFIEEKAMELLEDGLRAQFAPESFPAGIPLHKVLSELWTRTTKPESKGVLLLVMDLSRRAWNGSSRAQEFYAKQQRLWLELLLNYLPNKDAVEDILQSFQGAVLAYLVTGNSERGKRMLNRLSKRPDFQQRARTGVRKK